MPTDRLTQLFQIEKESSQDPFVPYAIGLEYLNIGKPEAAYSYFEKAIKNHPDYLPAYYQIGKTCENLQKVDAAKTFYLKGIEIADKASDTKTKNELNEALEAL